MKNNPFSFRRRPIDSFQWSFLKWLFISIVAGWFIGAASAGFLTSLAWATQTREAHHALIWFLPLGGWVVGLAYHYFGKKVVAGNDLLINKVQQSQQQIIPFIMAPLVYIGTIITHLFGGSAGREGTAVQIGAAISDQFSRILKFDEVGRRMLVMVGISAGFAGVFGTPLAGAVFALEVIIVGRMRYEAIMPCFIAAVVSDWTVHFLQVPHTTYAIGVVQALHFESIIWALIAGLFFGLASRLFVLTGNLWKKLSNQIKFPPIRPLVGGAVIAVLVFLMGTTKYIGLGIPTILASFTAELPPYDFIIKLLLTTFTLSFGFKGGEVTPLFFIGATLGNALALFLPLPYPLLAGMGFVAVFAGATNTPIACILMGIELFGADYGVFIALACIAAYVVSGHSGIYSSQIIGSAKHTAQSKDKGKALSDIHHQ